MTQYQFDFLIATIANLTRDLQKSHATNEVLLEMLASKFELDIVKLKKDIGKKEAELVFECQKTWDYTANHVGLNNDSQC